MMVLLHVDDSYRGLGIIGVFKNLTQEWCEGSRWGDLGGWNRSESTLCVKHSSQGKYTISTQAISVSPLLHPAPR